MTYKYSNSPHRIVSKIEMHKYHMKPVIIQIIWPKQDKHEKQRLNSLNGKGAS